MILNKLELTFEETKTLLINLTAAMFYMCCYMLLKNIKMRQTFYIKKTRLKELKSFIRAYLPKTRFFHNPLDSGNDFCICLTMPVEESNKLNELFNKWYNLDNPKPSNKRFFDKVRTFFNCI